MKEKEMEMKMTSLINLPGDVLINKILLKLDMKSLGKLRCVCKHLQSFISSPDFLNMHICHQHNNNPLVLLFSGNKRRIHSISLNGITHDIKPYCPEKVEITRFPSVFHSWNPVFFGSFNGLLCLVEINNSPPILWNPFTKEYKKLPPPSPRPETPFSSKPDILFGYSCFVLAYGFGYDSIINDYKVIQCENIIYHQYIRSSGDTEYTIITNFQVYTLGTDTWRRINDDDNPYRSYCTTPYHYKTPGMFVNGALHWILREKKSSGSKIIAFDIEKEMFRAEVPRPHSNLSDSSCNWSLHVLKGCLCIYERLKRELSPCIDVWMMKDYGVIESWTKLFTITDAFASGNLNFKVLKFCENGKVIVARDYKSLPDLIVYDPINEKSQTIDLGEIPAGKPDSISYTEIHIESIVSLNTGRKQTFRNS